MREIVFDTETTGMDPEDGDRLVEIGCVEIENQVPTGRTYHQYINPERDIPAEAQAIHGITDEFVKDKPVFSQIFTEFLDFIGNTELVAHNASFDMKFINAELRGVGYPSIARKRVTDSLAIARQKFPGSPASLDALCRRFDINLSEREFHGALLDAHLLAEVYLELMGGRQHGLTLAATNNTSSDLMSGNTDAAMNIVERPFREPRVFKPSRNEQEAHDELLGKLTDPIWASS